jgi:hypothetical protein
MALAWSTRQPRCAANWRNSPPSPTCRPRRWSTRTIRHRRRQQRHQSQITFTTSRLSTKRSSTSTSARQRQRSPV